MKATVLDLRYRMRDVLAAINRQEIVTVYHRGKKTARLLPATPARQGDVKTHPFFGSQGKTSAKAVAKIMDDLRGGRHRAL